MFKLINIPDFQKIKLTRAIANDLNEHGKYEDCQCFFDWNQMADEFILAFWAEDEEEISRLMRKEDSFGEGSFSDYEDDIREIMSLLKHFIKSFCTSKLIPPQAEVSKSKAKLIERIEYLCPHCKTLNERALRKNPPYITSCDACGNDIEVLPPDGNNATS